MTKKDFLVKRIGADGYDYVTFGGCASLRSQGDVYPTYDEAIDAAKKSAGKNIDYQYAIYEMVAVVEAPAPDVNVTKL